MIPLRTLPEKVSELDPLKETVVYCRSGARSAKAVEFLRNNGFRNAKNLVGGIEAWAERIDQSLPTY